jgi:uncharacterized protein (DUF952 family)
MSIPSEAMPSESSIPSESMPFHGTLFHIAEQPFWDAAQKAGAYRALSLDSEGFIHLSTPVQYVATANRYYVGRSDLVLLEVSENEIAGTELRYEKSTNDELFPHFYGELPLNAVMRVHMFLPNVDGTFSAPTSVAVNI